MAHNYMQAIAWMGGFSEASLRCISERTVKDTDQPTDGMALYRGPTSNTAVCIIKHEYQKSSDGTQRTDTIALRSVQPMNCIGLGLRVVEGLFNILEEFLQTNDEPTDGKTYVMYHGTTSSAAANIIRNGFFQSSDGMLGRGVYVSRDKDKALRYPLYNKSDQVVLKLRVNVGKVIKIDQQNHPLQKTWHDHGYDTAWVPPYCGMVNSGLQEDCIWDTERIKVVGVAHATCTHVKQFLDGLVEQYAQ